MATATQTLTPSQWNSIFSLPADGKPYNVAGIAFRATHFPATSMKVEHVIAETQFGTLRRRFVSSNQRFLLRGLWRQAI